MARIYTIYKITFSNPDEYKTAYAMEPTAGVDGESMCFTDQGFAKLWFDTFINCGFSVSKNF